MNKDQTKRKTMNQFKISSIKQPLLSMIVLLGLCLTVSAQSDWKASVGAQMQFSELKADNGLLQTSYDPGAGINLGISYKLTDNLSLHSGVGLSYLEASSSISNYSDEVSATDLEGENFDFRYSLQSYSETQKSTILSIPIGLQYETSGNQTRLYTKVGASAQIFLSPTTEGSANRLVTSGYFERFNAELTAPRFAGFGTYNEIDFTENDLEIKNSLNAFLELGIKENFGSGWVYFGLFMEYGLNDLLENNGSSLINYNQDTPTDFISNSSLNASNQNTGMPFFEKVSLNIIGFRIKYEFGI